MIGLVLSAFGCVILGYILKHGFHLKARWNVSIPMTLYVISGTLFYFGYYS